MMFDYRYVIIILGVVAFVLWLRWYLVDRAIRPAAIAPLSWLANVLAFFTWTTFVRDPGTLIDVANGWSRVVYTHALVLLIGAVIELRKHKKGT